jgi:hypothetical protein
MYLQSKLSKETQTITKQEKLNEGAVCRESHQRTSPSILKRQKPLIITRTTIHGEENRFAVLTRNPNRKPPRRVKATRRSPRDRTAVESGWSTRD